MSAGDLLNALHKVKRTGNGRWIAQCPAHQDKGPSLSVREEDDGRILMHCFAGCDTYSVLQSVGLDWSAIMPEKHLGDFKPEKRVISAPDALRLIKNEVRIIALYAFEMSKGRVIPSSDLERLCNALERVNKAAEMAGV